MTHKRIHIYGNTEDDFQQNRAGNLTPLQQAQLRARYTWELLVIGLMLTFAVVFTLLLWEPLRAALTTEVRLLTRLAYTAWGGALLYMLWYAYGLFRVMTASRVRARTGTMRAWLRSVQRANGGRVRVRGMVLQVPPEKVGRFNALAHGTVYYVGPLRVVLLAESHPPTTP